MTTRHRKRSVLRHLVIPALSILFGAYFAYHMVTGDLGLRAREQIEAEAARLRAQLADVRGERERLEQRVKLMRAAAIDPDLVDERARVQLNMVRPDEIVIFRASMGQNVSRQTAALQ
ncbi:septum formation initiator family protein [Pseudoxanthobacter sp.]|uniref:FtsB family cell division protein n=1 Tax=Pseudoxanthobacter sp. TaxID=1925742 RepID=UPI002FE2503C